MNALRTYQSDIYTNARRALADNRAICIQLATGAGKTPVMAAMCESVVSKKKRAWIIVNRKELLSQASGHLRKWSVSHGIIAPNMQESKAYQVHVVSKDTLIRRYDRIKNWPDLLIFDEAHLYLDRQLEIISHLPDYSKIIGMTATPERLDGRGLWSGASDIYKIINGKMTNERMEGRAYWSGAGGVYDDLIEGPSIPWLTERGFLSPLRYFSPPLEGLENLHIRKGEYDEEELNALLERKKIYGELVGHYSKHGNGKPALIFCRSVKSAYQTAERFRDKGYNFHCIEGRMSDSKRRELVQALTAGTIDGLTGCDVFVYGIDIPRVEYGASIRPTLSRALCMQMIGRILRPFTDPITGYEKTDAMFFDHVNLIIEHQDEKYPGIPLHYVPEITWNFHGREKRKRNKNNNVKLCVYKDFLYCDKPTCGNCEFNPDKTVKDCRKPMIIIPATLEEIKKPISFADRPYEEKREIQDRIGALVLDYKQTMSPGAVGELLKIADDLGYSVFWVYHRLMDEGRHTVNVPLLHEIARQKGWKPGWVFFAMKKVKYHKKTENEFREVMG